MLNNCCAMLNNCCVAADQGGWEQSVWGGARCCLNKRQLGSPKLITLFWASSDDIMTDGNEDVGAGGRKSYLLRRHHDVGRAGWMGVKMAEHTLVVHTTAHWCFTSVDLNGSHSPLRSLSLKHAHTHTHRSDMMSPEAERGGGHIKAEPASQPARGLVIVCDYHFLALQKIREFAELHRGRLSTRRLTSGLCCMQIQSLTCLIRLAEITFS